MAIIEKGKLIYSGPVQGVRDQMATGAIYWVTVRGDQAQALELPKLAPRYRKSSRPTVKSRLCSETSETDPGFIAEVLVRGGLKLVGLWE
ncbi:MAG: hypothetical protein U1G07_15915 [Verrucomicrobiota bacterium]